jgi:hypothetical protein
MERTGRAPWYRVAERSVSRVDLMLRDRFAMYAEDYSSMRLTAERFRRNTAPVGARL